jgi:hypothetical protein
MRTNRDGPVSSASAVKSCRCEHDRILWPESTSA